MKVFKRIVIILLSLIALTVAIVFAIDSIGTSSTDSSKQAGPECAKEPDLISWIFQKSIDNDYWESIISEYTQSSYVARYTPEISDDKFSKICLDAFEESIEYCKKVSDKAELMEYFDDLWANEINYSWRKIRSNRQEAESIIRSLYEGFYYYFRDIAKQEVQMLEWRPEKNSQSEAFKGYLVTYEIGSGYYVLIHLIERSDSWNASIKYRGTSLSTLTTYYN